MQGIVSDKTITETATHIKSFKRSKKQFLEMKKQQNESTSKENLKILIT